LIADRKNLAAQAAALVSGQQDIIANAANLSSLLFYALDEVNWVGFYFLKGSELVVGPFQGRPACVSIPMGKGVCGTAAETRKVQRVADVHAFEGHIACDVDSRSEIVLPLVRNGELIGVLDLDSLVNNRFDEKDEQLLQEIAEIFIHSLG
jgi:L-methionine (R)-S-oxide reductase